MVGKEVRGEITGKKIFHKFNFTNFTDESIFDEFSFDEIESRSRSPECIRKFSHKFLAELEKSAFLPSEESPRIQRREIRNIRLEEPPANVTEVHQNNMMHNERGYLKVQVSDTGCGIAQSDIPKLFGMFVQAQRSSNSMLGGTGLGLWICKQLCQKMNGDITLYSQLGKGTQFVFYIPVQNDKINQYSTGIVHQKQEKVKVLVVDDHAFNRHLHKLLLEREGAQITLASNGKEALEKVKEKGLNYFDFILLDIFMPVMDGFTAVQKIREAEAEINKTNKLDIYFISGEYYSEEEVMAAFLKRGGISDTSGIRCLRNYYS